jgi:hypothetical protein
MSDYDRACIRDAIHSRSVLNPIHWLLLAGVVRPHYGDPKRLRWPLSVDPKHMWVHNWRCPGQRFGLFRNLPSVVRDVGTWLPRRWGFYVLGLEVGQRG